MSYPRLSRTPMELPTVKLLTQDFDNFFEPLVQGWIRRLYDAGHVFKTKEIKVSVGPWRSYDVYWDASREPGVLYLDFYSVVRHYRIDYPEELTALI